jgi:uncharacterized protein YjbI with pentapeptide repeats
MSYPVWRLSLDRAPLQAHRAWFDRGKSGPGRLVLEDQNLQGAKAPLNFPGARFVRCDLSGASLPLFKLDELELVDCKLDDANLARTHFPGASIEGTTFRRADLRLAHFHHARIRDSDLGETKLDRGLFIGAVLERVSFAGAHLVDTVFDDARLIDCDLRGCDLSRVDPVLDLARTTRARFERCDLRGAKLDGRRIDGTVFDHCRMDGMTGKPEIQGPYTITAPEGSTVEDIESAWR